jgi:hypothetical protein
VVGHLCARDCMKGTLREGSFTGEPEKYVEQGSEMGVCFSRGPAFGEHEWALSWGLLIRGMFMRSLRDMQNAL